MGPGEGAGKLVGGEQEIHPVVEPGSVPRPLPPTPWVSHSLRESITLALSLFITKGSVKLCLSNSRFHYSEHLSIQNLVSVGFYDPKILSQHFLFLGSSDITR